MPANSSNIGSAFGAPAELPPAPGDAAQVRVQINTIRALAMDAVQQANSGHPGTAMALAPLAHTIFERFLRADPADPHWPGRDRFVLSAGHACVLLYSLLHLTGYELSLEDLKGFRQWGSLTPGHPERGHVPGVELTTGPLGQGIASAVGLAIAERVLAERFNRPGLEIVDHRTWVICSDGDLMEGISQEAASLAGSFGLGKLIVCYDENRITIDGPTALSFEAEEHVERFAASGWHVQRIGDAEDTERLAAALQAARAEGARPSFIAVRSHIAYPAPHARDTSKAHGAPLGEAEVRATKQAMGFDPDTAFPVDAEVYEQMSLRERGARWHEEWRERFDRWCSAYPQLAGEWQQAQAGQLAAGWQRSLPRFAVGESVATRSAGQETMAAFAPYAPTMVGGSADLVESTKTHFEGAGQMSAAHAGRNIPFGIREHAMGAIVNGLAAHGGIVSPYGSTFFVFSDYMRGSVRLSALMELPVVWVWTHDSIAVGEDGPTHQPIEHFAALRAIPGLWVIRPSDANETVAAWQLALERDDGPVALLLSRQGIPVLDRPAGLDLPAQVRRGAYLLWQSEGCELALQESGGATGGGPLVIVATGSEVHACLQAAEELAERGVQVRVVAMPCMELFEAQDVEYRRALLGPAGTQRLAVEPGARQCWWRWVGDRGEVHGLDRFGASAPAKRVLAELGFDKQGIIAKATELLGR